MDPRRQVTIVEAGPKILGMFSEHLIEYYLAGLQRKEVDVRVNTLLAKVEIRTASLQMQDLGPEKTRAVIISSHPGLKSSDRISAPSLLQDSRPLLSYARTSTRPAAATSPSPTSRTRTARWRSGHSAGCVGHVQDTSMTRPGHVLRCSPSA